MFKPKERTVVKNYLQAVEEIIKIEKQCKVSINCDTIHHYTNINILSEYISRNLQIKLSRLDKVNDLTEGYLSNISHINNNAKNNTFVSCFQSDSNESIPMWVLYARKRELKLEEGIKFGVKISFPFVIFSKKIQDAEVIDNTNKKILCCSFFNDNKLIEKHLCDLKPIIFSKDIIKVKYDNEIANRDLFAYLKRGESKDSNSTIEEINNGAQAYGVTSYKLNGICKYNFWSYENEIRIRVITMHNGYMPTGEIPNQKPYEYLFLQLDQKLFNKMTITFNPFIKLEKFEEWKKKLLTEFDWLKENQIKRSILAEQIRF